MKAARPVAGKRRGGWCKGRRAGPNPASGAALDPDGGGDGRQGAAGRRSPAHGLPPDCCCSLPVPAARRSVVVRAEEAAAPAAPAKKPEVGPKRGSYVSAAAAAGSSARHGGSTDRASGSMLQCCHGSAMPRQARQWMRMCIQAACRCHTKFACRSQAAALHALHSCAPSPVLFALQVRIMRPESYWCVPLGVAQGCSS